jgi:hypothetical protein
MIPLNDPRLDPEKHEITSPEYFHHMEAARLLMEKLDWKGEMVGGALNNNGTKVWVFMATKNFIGISPIIKRW